VKLAFEFWSQRLETRLVELRAGKVADDKDGM
jgi:hypothetical protein